VNATDGTELWGEEYNPKMADILGAQADISRKIVVKLRFGSPETSRNAWPSPPTEYPEAYQLYLKGQRGEVHGRGGEDKESSIFVRRSTWIQTMPWPTVDWLLRIRTGTTIFSYRHMIQCPGRVSRQRRLWN
jgi:hypothetical protein